jgi:magnesium-transporting ATPase (P-type)
MYPPTASPTNSIAQPFQAIVEVLANGQVAAWVTEFQDSKVIAADRATAIVELEKVLKKRLESIYRVVIEVGDIQSIDTLPRIPSDDQFFRELMATFRASQ